MTKQELEVAKLSLENEINSYINEFEEILRISKNASGYLEKNNSTFIKQISKVTTIELNCEEAISYLKQGIKKLGTTRIEECNNGEFRLVYDSDEDVRFMEKRTYEINEHKRHFKEKFYSSMSRIYFYTTKKGR